MVLHTYCIPCTITLAVKNFGEFDEWHLNHHFFARWSQERSEPTTFWVVNMKSILHWLNPLWYDRLSYVWQCLLCEQQHKYNVESNTVQPQCMTTIEVDVPMNTMHIPCMYIIFTCLLRGEHSPFSSTAFVMNTVLLCSELGQISFMARCPSTASIHMFHYSVLSQLFLYTG